MMMNVVKFVMLVGIKYKTNVLKYMQLEGLLIKTEENLIKTFIQDVLRPWIWIK